MVEVYVFYGDCIDILNSNEEFFRSRNINFVYIDPPFNTGKRQKRGTIYYTDFNSPVTPLKYFRNVENMILSVFGGASKYLDFLYNVLEKYKGVVSRDASFMVHVDYRTVHYVKVMLDYLFGRECFMNEIIWAYDFGGRSKRYWPRKHDNILWYVKDPNRYTFNYEEIDRIPYMAPGLVGKEKAARGKTPTDVWWHTIVPTNSKEKTGYPTQKPLGVLERIIKVHTNPGDWVLDFFAGSGTTGVAAIKHGRNAILIDNNRVAVEIMIKRMIETSKNIKYNIRLYTNC